MIITYKYNDLIIFEAVKYLQVEGESCLTTDQVLITSWVSTNQKPIVSEMDF